MAVYDDKLLNGEQLGTLVNLIKQADNTKQPLLSADNKLAPEYVNTNTNYQFVTEAQKTAWSAKADTSDIPDDLADLREDTTHRVVTDVEKATWNGKANASDIPDELADLSDDATHRLVTDTEKATWNGKADASDIPDSLDDLTDDATHRLVTDAEKTIWNGKTDMAAVEAKGYQTAAQVTSTVESYGYQTSQQVQSAITSAVSGLTGFHFEIVNSLPTTDIDTNCIYLILKSTTTTNNIYTEYAYVNGNWEILGDTSVSFETLSQSEVETIWNSVT